MCQLQTEEDAKKYDSHKRLLSEQGYLRCIPFCWGWCRERAALLFYSRTLMPLWWAWSKGRTSGHLKCWSLCPQTPLRKGLIFGLVPFCSFISTEEWLELCNLLHQHSWLKLNCSVQVKNELKPFLKATLMSIPCQEGKERETPLHRMCIWKASRRSFHELE